MFLRMADIHRVYCGPGIVRLARQHDIDLKSAIKAGGVEEHVLRDKGLGAEADLIIAAIKK